MHVEYLYLNCVLQETSRPRSSFHYFRNQIIVGRCYQHLPTTQLTVPSWRSGCGVNLSRSKFDSGVQIMRDLLLTLTHRSIFRFSDLPVELQSRILDFVISDYAVPGPKSQGLFTWFESRRVVLGLRLPPEGIFGVSRLFRELSLKAFYGLPDSPPVCLKRSSTRQESSWPLSVWPAQCFIDDACLRRATVWEKVIVPMGGCWMGVHNEISAMSTILSHMSAVSQLHLTIYLRDPETMSEHGHSRYHQWQRVIETLSRLPRLKQLDFDIEVANRYIEPVLRSGPPTKRRVHLHEINPALRQWLIEHDQTRFEIVYAGGLSKRQILDAFYRSLDLAYHILVARYRNACDKGPLPRPDFMNDVAPTKF